jgi:hypothetical protein
MVDVVRWMTNFFFIFGLAGIIMGIGYDDSFFLVRGILLLFACLFFDIYHLRGRINKLEEQ